MLLRCHALQDLGNFLVINSWRKGKTNTYLSGGLAHHSLNKVYTILVSSNKAKHGVFKMTLPNLEKAWAPLGTEFFPPPRGGLEQRCDASMRNLKNHQIWLLNAEEKSSTFVLGYDLDAKFIGENIWHWWIIFGPWLIFAYYFIT